MNKITYVPTRYKENPQAKPTKISFKRLGEIFGCTAEEIEAETKERYGDMWEYYVPFAEGIQCPFGERNLMDDTCYIGSEVHKCKYFMQYVHDGEHNGTIKCCCPKERVVAEKGKPVQLSLFDSFFD